jgi:pentatricopeptide repeat protein
MAMTVRVRLTGEAEKFVREMQEDGIEPRDAIASGLWLASVARRTNRLAIAREGVEYRRESRDFIEQILVFRTPDKPGDNSGDVLAGGEPGPSSVA